MSAAEPTVSSLPTAGELTGKAALPKASLRLISLLGLMALAVPGLVGAVLVLTASGF